MPGARVQLPGRGVPVQPGGGAHRRPRGRPPHLPRGGRLRCRHRPGFPDGEIFHIKH